LLFFVQHEEIDQTVLAALYEKDAQNYGEEDALIKQARYQKNLEKRKKISCIGGPKKGQNGAG
jgi:hypothetical protein